MMALLKKFLHIKTSEDAAADMRDEPIVKDAIKSLKRVDHLTGSKFADRILVELEALEGKRR